MKVFYPGYFPNFHCIASACPDSCCKEWAVDVDAESTAYYRALPGALGDRLREVLKDADGGTVMTITDGRCPMWRKDGLCEIQAQLGHDALCKTCREFPRLQHDYGDFVELGLELSCPEAARLILGAQDWNMEAMSAPGGAEPEYDREVMAILKSSREKVLAFLADRTCPLPHGLAAILLYAHNVQAQIDGGDAVSFGPETCLEAAQKYAGNGDLMLLLDFFQDLEILTPEWKSLLEHGSTAPTWCDAHRAMVGYLVQRYWLQAISDLDLVCRVKFMIAAFLVVRSLHVDTVRGAQLFSKEIENDPANVEAILDGAYASPALTDNNLLQLLLC